MTALSRADASPDVAALLTPEAVRTRCTELLEKAVSDGLPWFRVDLSRLPEAAARVEAEIRRNYPSLDVPFHSRWRHFAFDGNDLWAAMSESHGLSGAERTVAGADLAVVSVLLDAGAGPDWVYRDAATGIELGRSEGLALASLRLFESGALSSDAANPLRVDAAALKALDAATLADVMQAGPDNPLVGVEQRAGLLNRLGAAMEARPATFVRDGTVRPGHLLLQLSERGSVAARDILVALLENLTDIWPSPIRLDGAPLGDVGRHAALVRDDATNGLVPFHKLSQWMSYSLIEPLQWLGTEVTALDGLTGLAEYRNGGLFIDTGVVTLHDPSLASVPHEPTAELIVEWRALTVALLDRVAEAVRTACGRELPLASVLEGGTWSAGRRIAGELRPGGPPPLQIASDATVF